MNDYDDRRYPEDEPVFPGTVRGAGIAWIVFGGLILANILVVLIVALSLEAKDRAPGDLRGDRLAEVLGIVVCAGLFLGLIGGGFIYVGVQSVNGAAQDTLGNGIGSIIFGVLNLAAGIARIGAGFFIDGVISVLCGSGLLAAGVMALVGREEYRAWRRAHKARRRYRGDFEGEEPYPPRRRYERDEDEPPPRRYPPDDRYRERPDE